MQFSISAAFFSLALATLGLAAPAANPSAAEIGQRSPNSDAEPYDWNKDWDGKVTRIEEIGKDVTAPGISKRTLGLIYICPAYDWQPADGVGCSHVQFDYPNQCVYLSPQYYAKTLSAVGPDGGTWCMLFTSPDCGSGASDVFSYPGMGRLDGYWATWNDNTGSIKCWW